MADKLEGTILIVDDMPENVTLLSRILANQGYTVKTAGNGAQAIDYAQTSSPDLILLDINMPEMDGFETCVRLKKDVRTRDIPVIFISALDGVEDKKKPSMSGAWITFPNHLIMKKFGRGWRRIWQFFGCVSSFNQQTGN